MKKIIALALALIMCMGILPVFALASDDKMTVKVVAPAEWEECYVYSWEPEAFGSWPGTKITDDTFELPSAVQGMVISAGMNMPQTVDILDVNFVASTEITITVGEVGNDGKHSYILEEVAPQPQPTEPIQPTTTPPTQPTDPAPVEKYTLTVEAPASWTTVYAYTWEPASLGDFPGTEMTKISENTYECAIDGNLINLILSFSDHDQTYQQTNDLVIIPGRDVSIKIAEDATCNITYPDYPPASPLPLPGTVLSNYRVVGNADWLGNWDPAFEDGRMIELGNGVYRKKFTDVAPGTYEIKITKDGQWDGAYGDNGQNFCFTVDQKCNISVDLRIKDGEGIVEVYGYPIDWIEEENPDDSDLPMILPVVLLAICIVALPVALYKRKNIQ